jgi:hypothetical protein
MTRTLIVSTAQGNNYTENCYPVRVSGHAVTKSDLQNRVHGVLEITPPPVIHMPFDASKA